MEDPQEPREVPTTTRGELGIRMWPAGLIVAGGSLVLAYIALFKDGDRQAKNLESLLVLLVVLGLLLLWILLFSRLRWKTRLLSLGGVVATLGLLAGCFEITGVSGDLVPVVAWRWRSSKPLPDLPSNDSVVGNRPGDDGNDQSAIPIASNDLPPFPQFRGPNRNSILAGPVIDPAWQTQPPKQLWRRKIGGGWAGFATFQQYAITMEQREQQEYVSCYHLLTGEPLWSHSYDAHYQSTVAGNGPRTVPSIHEGRVYAAGATGVLTCLELTTGTVIWKTNLLDDHDRTVPEWGYSASTLIHDNKVIVNPGGHETSMAAYHATTGSRLWFDGTGGSHHSSPILAELYGVQQTLIFHKPQIAAHSLEDGRVLWEYDWFGPEHPNVTMPIVLPGNRILASAGYGEGTEVFEVSYDGHSKWSTQTVWRSNRLKSKFGAVIAVDEFAYGLDDGVLTCIDLNDGKRKWKKGRYGHGQMILVADKFVLLTEKGDIVLVERNSEHHNEMARLTAFDSKTWNPPAVSGKYLLVRNDLEAACYELPVQRGAEQSQP